MGWWSEDILGGDQPLDCLGTLAEEMGVEYNYGDDQPGQIVGYVLPREVVEAKMTDLVNLCGKQNDSVLWQVLGVVALRTGAKLSGAQKKFITDAARRDDWMREDGESSARGGFILNFIGSIAAHEPGMVWKPTARGFTSLDEIQRVEAERKAEDKARARRIIVAAIDAAGLKGQARATIGATLTQDDCLTAASDELSRVVNEGLKQARKEARKGL
jgi:hypothetical protein